MQFALALIIAFSYLVYSLTDSSHANFSIIAHEFFRLRPNRPPQPRDTQIYQARDVSQPPDSEPLFLDTDFNIDAVIGLSRRIKVIHLHSNRAKSGPTNAAVNSKPPSNASLDPEVQKQTPASESQSKVRPKK